jgi:PAS domain S-box-containing protein
VSVTRVLLVEDNPGDAELIAIALERAGSYELEVVGRLADALDRVTANGLDLVLLDLGLPDSEGLDTFLRMNRRAPHLPMVVLTGSEDDTLALQAVREGAQDYLVKGVPPSLLLRSLRYALERKRGQEALRLSQTQLAEAQRLAHVGSFVWDLGTDTASWSDELYRIFGLDREAFPARPDAVSTLVHPEDRAEVERVMTESLRTGKPFAIQSRIVRPDGEVRVLDSRGEVVADGSGRPVRLLGVSQDITERKRAEDVLRERERELEAARDQAVQASEFKSQFLANMSHEIRTPMNGVLGMAHLLLEMENDPQKRTYLRALKESGHNLLSIINDILDFSKVEAGQLELETIELDLHELVDTAVALFRSQASEKGLALDYSIVPEVPRWVLGDPVRVRQVLINLLSNAVKFTDSGRVRVKVGRGGGDNVRFEVSDTGIGIRLADHQRILDPFRQADSSTTRRFGGTGLGIAICRQLVSLMDGSFDYTSEVGQGSTFWFEVPLPVSTPAASPAASANGSAAPSAGRPDGGPQREKVLLAEDNPVNRLVAEAMLRELGYEVHLAQTGAEAVAAARRESYTFILMDCLMPEMDGYEAAASIRREPGPASRTPIIALTALAMKGDREKCLAAGMDDYLSKPLSPTALAAALERCRIGGVSASIANPLTGGPRHPGRRPGAPSEARTGETGSNRTS